MLKLKNEDAAGKVLIVDEEEEDFVEESNVSILSEIIENKPIKEPEIVKPSEVAKEPEIVRQPEIANKPKIERIF